jgi:hypothetical protein
VVFAIQDKDLFGETKIAINNPSASAVTNPFAETVPRVKIFRPSSRSTTPSKIKSVRNGVGLQ